ncbi:hypothetical protein ACUJ46_02560 [Sandaracinobacteroides sp. A072]|uniref:hypothetical protein n=1 Tax=Sandaracinobacteroides sp. A072 TaxID=3461146 RepID=UPI0040434452
MRNSMIKLSLAAALSAIAFTASPALASDVCAEAPAKLRALAGSADAGVQRKALRNVTLGEQLCEARNKSEANKKFGLAAKLMGTELASVLAVEGTAAAQ